MKKMQKIISNYYRDLDQEDPNIEFDDCFPVADPKPLLWMGRGIAAGIAAVMLVAVAIAYNAWQSSPQRSGQVMIASLVEKNQLQQALQSELKQSGVINLSAQQAAVIDRLLANLNDPGPMSDSTTLASVKGELFRTVADNGELELSASQTRAIAGLMSSWTPQLANGEVIANSWLDEPGLVQFLAGCSAFCHQDIPESQMQDYLADCVMKRSANPCSSIQAGFRNVGMESIP